VRTVDLLCFFLFLSCYSVQAKPLAALELYPYGEKVGIAAALKGPAALDLEMARSEYEIFSVTLPAPAKGGTKDKRKNKAETKDGNISILNPRISWTGAQPKLQLNTYLLGVHRFLSSSYQASLIPGEVADIPIPLEWLHKKWITVPLENLAARPAFLFEVMTEADASPGDYTGELSFEWQKQNYKIPIQLKVHSTILPKKFDLETSFGFAPWEVLKKHYGKWHKDNMALYRTYEKAALEHRIDLHKLYVKYPEKSAEDPLKEGPVAQQTFLGQMEPLFQGELNSSGFQMKVTDLPIPEEYKKVKNSTVPKENLEAFWKKMNATVLKHNLKERSYVYFVDEPKKETLDALGDDLRTIRKWAPDLHFLVTTPYRKTLEGAVNHWCIGLSSLDNPEEKSSEFYSQRTEQATKAVAKLSADKNETVPENEKFWIYVGCNAHGCTGTEDPGTPDLVIDRASAYQRAFPWIALRYKAQGLLYYDTVYGYGKGTAASPWKDAFSFKGYGEGNLFYPCTSTLGNCKEPRVISSLRLKILRDGLEDAQILTMALVKTPTLKDEIHKLVVSVRDFNKSAGAYEKLKRTALQALEKPSKLAEKQ
jgi:hypothetical protein